MNMIDDWKISISVDDILYGQGADPQTVRNRKPGLLAAAERALAEGTRFVHPVSVFQEVAVLARRHDRIVFGNHKAMTGQMVINHLGNAEQIVAAVCSIGSELEETVSQFINQEPLYALALDGLGNAAVENLAQRTCGTISERFLEKGLTASTPLSPGSPEWPVEIGQPQIFALVDPSIAGITLTSGGMMRPKKSVSFVVGIGPDMSQTNMCSVCSLQETCRYRHD